MLVLNFSLSISSTMLRDAMVSVSIAEISLKKVRERHAMDLVLPLTARTRSHRKVHHPASQEGNPPSVGVRDMNPTSFVVINPRNRENETQKHINLPPYGTPTQLVLGTPSRANHPKLVPWRKSSQTIPRCFQDHESRSRQSLPVHDM